MAKKKIDINPVFGHKSNIGLLQTAEELVDSLDSLSICLNHIDEKFIEEEKSDVKHKYSNLFDKLKENIDTARELSDTLKRERWRLSKREISLDLRMGELEDYKSHLKRDMSDMNQTVDCLSMRIVQLENALCEAQEIQEATEAEKKQAIEDLEESKKQIKGLKEKLDKATAEGQSLKQHRTDSALRKQFEDVTNRMEVLLVENHRLKDMIREKDDEIDRFSESSAGEHQSIGKTDSNVDTLSIGSANSDGQIIDKQTPEIAYV